MLSAKGKISVRQLFIIYLLAISAPIVRLTPTLTASHAKQAAWLSPIFAGILLTLLAFIIQSAFKSGKCGNLSDVFIKSIGKIAGKCLLSLYLVWLVILLSLYIRYYASRLIVSIFPGTDLPILSILILITALLAVRGGIESFARLSEFFFIILISVLILLFFLIFSSINIENIYPVTYYDFFPAALGIYPVLGIGCYFTYIFFLGEHVNDKENIRYVGLQSILYSTVNNVIILIMTVGVLGHSVTARATHPFFSSIKSISVLNTIERVESILISAWVIADFTIITLFIFMVLAIIKSLFNLTEVKCFSSQIAVFALIFSFYLASSAYELSEFSNKLALIVNIITCYVIPAIVIGIGKIRKTI